ncbi:KR domain-containing protein [Streptomyces sp. KL118A]|uniref:KR domain-containing protein n=1 Tax=Streptomyces sp. KL118A TaxID=3045153 RepID=UPI00278C5931|nr:KR domain-containing protein [Streptomyces sp. KL118A]
MKVTTLGTTAAERPAPEQAPRTRPGPPLHHTPLWVPAAPGPHHPPAFTPADSLLVVDSRDTGRAWAPLGVRTVRVGRDLSGSAPAWTSYLKALHRQEHAPRALVFDLPAATTDPERAAELTLPLLRALCCSTGRTPLHVAFLVTGRARPELAAAFGAIAQQAGAEDGRIHAVSVNVQALPPGAPDPLRTALGELALPRPKLAEVRYTPTGREVRVLRAAPGPRPGPPPAALRPGGRYLLTDTGEGDGARLALALARSHRARIVLLAPECGPAPADARITHVAGRPSRAADVRAAVRVALHHFGSPDGVLHCAGHAEGRPLSQLSAATARQVLADAVTGAVHLDEATAELPLDFFALTTAAPAYRTATGAALPAATGRALGALAAARAQRARAGLRRGLSLALCRPDRTGPPTPDALNRALARGPHELTAHPAAAH